MPLSMLRPGPFSLAVIVLGGLLPCARADEPPCPSQLTLPATPAGTPPAGKPATPPAARAPRGSGTPL